MTRFINTETAGKERTRLTKCVVLALRELMRQTEPNEESRDLAAFIYLSLKDIHDTIDSSVQAWEKRGYWVKADRFRLDWEWSGALAERMRPAVLNEDWANIAMISVQVGQKLMSIEVTPRNRLGTPWVGAWDRMHDNK